MLDSKDYCQYVLPIVVFHIIPEFDGSIVVDLFCSIQFEVIWTPLMSWQSPVAFVRARACFAIELFSIADRPSEMEVNPTAVAPSIGGENKKNKDKKKQMTVGQILQSVLGGLLKCLSRLWPCDHSSAKKVPLICSCRPCRIKENFRIMEEIGNESVLSTRENIIEEYESTDRTRERMY